MAETWASLLQELEAIWGEGEERPGAVSDLASPGEATRFWPRGTYSRIATWIHRAYGLAVQHSYSAFASNLDRLCERYTEEGKRVSQIDTLRLRDFGRPNFDLIDDDGEAYVDSLDMRHRFQLFLAELLDEAMQIERLTREVDQVLVQDDPFYPIAWFKNNTHLEDQALYKAAQRNKIRTTKRGGKRFFSLFDAQEEWPHLVPRDLK